jgi:hypothetical protein
VYGYYVPANPGNIGVGYNVHQDYIKIKGFTWADAGTIQDLFLFYFKLIKKNFVFYVTFRKFVRITIKKQHKARKDEFL